MHGVLSICDDVLTEILLSLSSCDLCQVACVSKEACNLAAHAAAARCSMHGYKCDVEEMSAGRYVRIMDDQLTADGIIHIIQALSYPARTWQGFSQVKECFEALGALDKLILNHPEFGVSRLLADEQTREATLYNLRCLGPDCCEQHACQIAFYLEDEYGHSVCAAAIYALTYAGLCSETIELFAKRLFHILDTDPRCTDIVGFLLLNYSVAWYEAQAVPVAARLQHRDPNVRGWAIHAMYQRLHRSTLEAHAAAIAPMLNDSSGYVRHWARQVVASIVGERMREYSRTGLQLVPPSTLRSLTSAKAYALDWRPVGLPDYEAAISDVLGGYR
jgi:hypothetical protein